MKEDETKQKRRKLMKNLPLRTKMDNLLKACINVKKVNKIF